MLLLQHFTKQCTKCNDIKILSLFSKDKYSKDGLRLKCKHCESEYYKANKSAINIRNKIYRDANKETMANMIKSWRIANLEHHINQQKMYRDINRERISEYQKAYFKTPNGKAKIKNILHKRRSITKQGDATSNDILELQQNAKVCYWCNQSLKNKKAHIDHYVPLSKGGEHTKNNLVVSCAKCNQTKSIKDPIVFANSIGKLF